MKKIILIGASGFVGSAILNEAISRDYKVTAVVRNPEKIAIKNDNLTVVKADVSSAETVDELCKGFDTVISAYNPGWANPDIYNETLSVYAAILKGAKAAGVKRLLCVGGAGTLFCAPGLRVMDSGIIPDAFLPAVKSLGEFYLNVLSNEKEIDWVFFSPAGNIAPGKRTGEFRLGKDDLIVDKDGNSNISVEDYAVAMMDEVEKMAHHQERFTIGY
jgi:putative NADH-flavin reductase